MLRKKAQSFFSESFPLMVFIDIISGFAFRNPEVDVFRTDLPDERFTIRGENSGKKAFPVFPVGMTLQNIFPGIHHGSILLHAHGKIIFQQVAIGFDQLKKGRSIFDGIITDEKKRIQVLQVRSSSELFVRLRYIFLFVRLSFDPVEVPKADKKKKHSA